MRALWCDHWCDYDELTIQEVAAPVLRPGSVRIRVEAAGVSFATQLVVAGKYQRKPPLPFSPGTEIAGTVIETAPDVSGLAAGMRVFAVCDWGGSAEEAVVDAIHVVPLPEPLELRAAPALAISYPTAAGALIWRGRLQADQWVLVHGAGGGVGLAAVEIAKALGAHVIARAGKDKHEGLRARGADAVLDSDAPFRDQVREISDGGVALIVDLLGKPVFDESLRSLGDGGVLLTIGYAAGGIPEVALNLLLLKNIGVAGFNWGTYVGWSPGDNRGAYAPAVRALWDQLVGWWQAGKICPTVHAAYPLSEFREAMKALRDRSAFGRIVLLPQE